MPKCFYKNLSQMSESGLGDGTPYGWGASAAPDAVNKYFTISVTAIPDLGTIVNNTWRGYVLYFPSSKNKYHITSSIASSGILYTFETPQVYDTGACYLLQTCYVSNSHELYPASNLGNGYKWLPWKGTTGAAAVINLLAHNFINDGGFERNNLTVYWTTVLDGGASGTAALNATTPILGLRDLLIDLTAGAGINVYQNLNASLLSGRTYKIILKARRSGTYVSNTFKVRIHTYDAAGATSECVTWGTMSSGVNTDSSWCPVLGTSNTWFWAEFTPNKDTSLPRLILRLEAAGYNVYIDEVFIYEKITVDKMIMDIHNLDMTTMSVRGYYCSPARTGVGATDYLDVLASTIARGTEILTYDLTSSIYPIYRITINAGTNRRWEIGELFIGETWTWSVGVTLPFDPEGKEWDSNYGQFIYSINGRLPAGIIATEYLKWRDWWERVGKNGRAFWWQFRTADKPIFVVNSGTEFEAAYNPIGRGLTFSFKEKDPITDEPEIEGDTELATTAYSRGLYVSYKSGTEIYISGGELDVHDGTYVRRLVSNVEITKDVSGLAASTTHFVYVDPPDSSNVITATNIIVDSTPPVFNHAKMGYYHPTNTDQRCIGSFDKYDTGAVLNRNRGVESEWSLYNNIHSYLEGLQITYRDSDEVNVNAGEIDIFDGNKFKRCILANNIYVPLTSPSSSIMYYIYASCPTSGRYLKIANFSFSTTKPVFSQALMGLYQTGDTTKRFIGSVPVKSDNTIRSFGRWGNRVVFASVLVVAGADLPTTPTDINLSAYVPSITGVHTTLSGQVFYDTGYPGWISMRENGTTRDIIVAGIGLFPTVNAIYAEIPVDSSGIIEYFAQYSGGKSAIYVHGYEEVR